LTANFEGEKNRFQLTEEKQKNFSAAVCSPPLSLPFSPSFSPLFSRRRRVPRSLRLDPLLVLRGLLHEKHISVALRRRLGVGVRQQLLDSQQHVSNSQRGPPPFVLVENGQADRARGVDVGVKEARGEFGFGRLCRVVVCRELQS
jgi:hypothetical protein